LNDSILSKTGLYKSGRKMYSTEYAVEN